MSDLIKETVSAFNEDLGGNVQTVGVKVGQTNPNARAPRINLGGAVSDVVNAIESRREKREASIERVAELDALAGEPIEEDADPITVRTYKRVDFMTKASAALKEASATFKTEAFNAATPEERQNILTKFKQEIANQAESSELMDDEMVQKYLTDQFRSLNLQKASAVHDYQNYTLPARTIGTHVDNTMGATASINGRASAGLISGKEASKQVKALWLRTFKQMRDPSVAGKLTGDQLQHIYYGEVARAIDTGTLEAYTAFKSTREYSSLPAANKQRLQSMYEREIREQQNQRISGIVDNYRQVLREVTASGEISRVQDLDNQIARLPANLRVQVEDKLERSRESFNKVSTALLMYDSRKSGITTSVLNDEQADYIFDITTRNKVNEAGVQNASSASIQQHQQSAALDMYKSSRTVSSKASAAYDISNPTFVDGILDARSQIAIAGIDTLRGQLVPERDIERIVGDSNYLRYTRYKRFAEQNLEPAIAMSRALQVEEDMANESAIDKASRRIREIDDIRVGGKIANALDSIKDVAAVSARYAASLFSPVGSLGYDMITGKTRAFGRSQFDLASVTQEAPITDTDLINPASSAVQAKLGMHNTRQLATALVKAQEERGMLGSEAMEYVQKNTQDSYLIANNNIITNEEVGDRLRNITNSDTRQVNRSLSLSLQALTPLVAIDPQIRRSIIADVARVSVRDSDGNEMQITDSEQKYQALAQYDPANPNDVTVSIDIAKYGKLYNDGGTLADGRVMRPLRSYINDYGATWSDAFKTRDGYINHRVDYDELSNSFVIETLDTDGEPLTYTSNVDIKFDARGKEVIKTIPEGSPLTSNLPRSWVELFVQSYSN